MVQSTLEEIDDVFIVQTVKHLTSSSAGANQPHLSQSTQVVRDSRFADTDCRRNRADVLFTLGQDGNDPDAAHVTQGTKELRDVGSRVLVEQSLSFLRGIRHVGIPE